jgi:predicted small secreted protein
MESRCALIRGVGSDIHGVYTGLNPFNSRDLCSESLCELMKGVGSDVHERLYRPETV